VKVRNLADTNTTVHDEPRDKFDPAKVASDRADEIAPPEVPAVPRGTVRMQDRDSMAACRQLTCILVVDLVATYG